MTLLNIGIIGPGRVAERHAKALQEVSDVRLLSICGRSLKKAQEFAAKYSTDFLIDVYDDFEQMLTDPNLDAVIIATPDNHHVKPIVSAMQAQKSILVEKPVCTSLNDLEQIIVARKKYSKTIAVGYHLRWHQGLRKIAELAHSNQLGKIYHLRLYWAVNFLDHAKWRISTDKVSWCCLSALGTHLIDFVRWAMLPGCGQFEDIKSITTNINDAQSDGENVIIIRFESGATASIFCSVLFDSPFTLELYAEKNNVFGYDLIGNVEDRKIKVGNENLVFQMRNSYVEQLNNFSRAIYNNKEPEVTLEEGLENVKILNLIMKRND